MFEKYRGKTSQNTGRAAEDVSFGQRLMDEAKTSPNKYFGCSHLNLLVSVTCKAATALSCVIIATSLQITTGRLLPLHNKVSTFQKQQNSPRQFIETEPLTIIDCNDSHTNQK